MFSTFSHFLISKAERIAEDFLEAWDKTADSTRSLKIPRFRLRIAARGNGSSIALAVIAPWVPGPERVSVLEVVVRNWTFGSQAVLSWLSGGAKPCE